jgi:hypothetical protein
MIFDKHSGLAMFLFAAAFLFYAFMVDGNTSPAPYESLSHELKYKLSLYSGLLCLALAGFAHIAYRVNSKIVNEK